MPEFLCWDACAIIHYFCDPQARRTDEKTMTKQRLAAIDAGMDALVREIDEGKRTLLLPAIWRIETLDYYISPENHEKMIAFFHSSDKALQIAVDGRISEKAHDLRNEIVKQRNAGNPKKMLKAADSIYLATAIHFNAELITFDSGLSNLASDPIREGVKISSPEDYTPPQMTLPFAESQISTTPA